MANLYNIELNDATTERLVQIAQRHCKLALEHSSGKYTI